MSDGASGGTKRRRRLAIAGLAVVAASALAWALLARSPGLPRDRTVWFLGQPPRTWGWARTPLCDAPDGRPCGYAVLDCDDWLRPCTEVLAEAESGWLQQTLVRLRLSAGAPERVSLVAVSSVTTESGTWVACVPELAALGPEWQPADLTGVWLVDGAPGEPEDRVELRADGTFADTAQSRAPRVGTWREKGGNLRLVWDAVGKDSEFKSGVFELSSDRRSYYGWRQTAWYCGRRE